MELVKVSVSFHPLPFALAAVAVLVAVGATAWTVNRTIENITDEVDERVASVQQMIEEGVSGATAALGQCEARLDQLLGTLPANEQEALEQLGQRTLDRLRGIRRP